MTFDEYQKAASRTADLSMHLERSLVMASMGLAGEAGEVVDIVKKMAFHGHALSEAKLTEEVADALWYIARICTALGVSMGDVAADNIEKLRQRYPDGFSHDASRNRAR